MTEFEFEEPKPNSIIETARVIGETITGLDDGNDKENTANMRVGAFAMISVGIGIALFSVMQPVGGWVGLAVKGVPAAIGVYASYSGYKVYNKLQEMTSTNEN